MSTTDYERHLTLDARLVMLRAMRDQTDGRMNEVILEAVLDSFGHRRNRDWIRTQLRELKNLGAVTLTEAGTVMIGAITRLGLDHVERRAIIEGVARPSPEV